MIAKGLPASPGAASGHIYFTAKDAEIAAERGEKVILVRQETSPEDLAGMIAAQGILTSRVGMTSHAAVVARGMGKCCVSGCNEIVVDEEKKEMKTRSISIGEGEFISLDGNTGMVYIGELETVEPELSGSFETIMKVRANADNPVDAEKAIELGAEGIGLCRTEHMFFEETRIADVRKMILAADTEERKLALSRLLPYQKEDFKGIYKVIEDRPVTIRLLDPPLHEFLPHGDEEIGKLAEEMGITFEKLKDRVVELHEFNPMLGHRGCRLAVTYPEIASMQAEAIIRAAIEVEREMECKIEPEIMIPLVGIEKEIENVKKTVVDKIESILNSEGVEMTDQIAKHAEFFSFGTNDLTQMTFGFSRDDTGKIINEYLEKGIFIDDPFQTIDREGVGELMRRAIRLGKEERPNIKLGICGEHGGDPKSVEFCHELGLQYVSCSPFRVPIARLAAAQAVLKESENSKAE